MSASKMSMTISRKFRRNKFQQTAINAAKLDKIKILQGNYQGLSNKIPVLLVFLKEKSIQIVCLNEVKRWHNDNLILRRYKDDSD